MVAAAALAVLVTVSPVSAYDPEVVFAKGATVFGLQIGGGAANNIEGQRTVSDISFLTATPRVSHLFLPPLGSGLLRSAVEPGLEGWFQYYLSPQGATAEGLKLAMRYHLIGFGRLVPYLEITGGAGGTSLRVREIDSAFTFVAEAGAGGVVLHHGHGRAECGLSVPAHLERTHLGPEPGLQLRHGDRWCLVLLQVRAR
jgi:hypothetical protein